MSINVNINVEKNVNNVKIFTGMEIIEYDC